MKLSTGNEPKFNFFKTYIAPAFLLFVIPLFSLWFFHHVQADFNRQALVNIERSIQQDKSLDTEQKGRVIEFFRQTPISEMLASNDPQFSKVQARTSYKIRLEYTTFYWMIRLALISLISGIVVFIIAGFSVLFSLRSQQVQYYSLSIGWHVLRIFATAQVLIQGCLAVALSFWVTAFWLNHYIPKLIALAAIFTIVAAAAVIKAIFKRLDKTFTVEGVVIERGTNALLWDDLDRISAAVGTAAPDRIVAGIDNNFFVTEHAVTVNGKVYQGRTLFVSLSLLRVLDGADADAVMAHEMAHFSGKDTLYSKKISPLLNRYGMYLEALQAGGISLPVYYFMLCFRGMFEISLRKLGRQRELRADRIAADTASPQAIARSLLKIAAYSDYRAKVEAQLFNAEQIHTNVDIPGRVQAGFQTFAAAFVEEGQYQQLKTAHPFDSHPPIEQRLESVGVQLAPDDVLSILHEQADRRWYRNITNADELEAQQWAAFEEKFRQFHEHILAYRYLPETEAERQIVLKYFPGVMFQGKKKGTLLIDYEKITYSDWPEPLRFDAISRCQSENSTLGHPQLRFTCTQKDIGKRILPLDIFQAKQEVLLKVFNEYYSRHLTMIKYRQEKAAATNESP